MYCDKINKIDIKEVQNNVYFVALKTNLLQRAVFFDRDGVLNREIGDYVCRIDDFEVLPDAVDCIKLAKEMGFLAIVVTNQGGIDKQLYSEHDLASFHRKLQEKCLEKGTQIDDFYYCPHHPVKGNCICRKPDSGLLEKAIAKYHIDTFYSLMIGDTPRDMEAAKKAGIKGLLVQPNSEKIRLLEKELQAIIKK
jgi:D-glycero-D-manno-heptose 1,7-bisphosphate phosphatase